MKWPLIMLLAASPALAAQPVITPQSNFGLGLNMKTIASEIDERETPDSNNMINTLTGAMEKRNGSRFYINQAYSTNPIVSLYQAYGSTVSGVVNKVLIASTRDRLITSTGGINPLWVTISSGHPHNTKWRFTTAQNKVIMCEDSLTSDIKRYDIMTGSFTDLVNQFTASDTTKVRAKYIANIGDQIIAANVALVSTPGALGTGTTQYNSRIYYTPIFFYSSFTFQRYLTFDENDGEAITGISDFQGIYIWKPSKIFKLTYSNLNPGGDMSVQTIVNGFGLFAPNSLAFTGDFFIFCDKGSVRLWDGSVKTRLQVEQESRVVSDKIQPIVDRCIRAGTWQNAVGFWYPKRRWYILSVEDPTLNPKGKQNICLVLDFDTLSWFRFTNWDASAFIAKDQAGDAGELLYGSSDDGYAYYADDEISANDARREFSINDMDRAGDWIGGQIQAENNVIKEGTASIRMVAPEIPRYSSAAFMSVINLGEWMDKRRVNKNDKISFKVYAVSATNIQNLRVDLSIDEDARDNFNVNFTSVVFSSNVLNGDSVWTTIEVALSSFPMQDNWTNLQTENFPFANTLTYFGIRFFATGTTGGFTCYFDDLRLVDDTERPLSAYRWSKQFGGNNAKEFKEIYLNADLNPDAKIYLDIYKDFGSFVDRRAISGDFGKEVFVAGYSSQPNVTKLDSVTFDRIISTEARIVNAFSIESIANDENFIYGGDQYNNRLVKIDKSTFSAFVATCCSLGTGTTNFNFIGQIGMDRENLYVADIKNHRVKIHKKSDLTFVKSFGQLGNNTTSFHLPKGVAVDGDGGDIFVANDGGPYNIQKLDKETGAFKLSADLDLDTYGDPSLAVDDKNLYVAYRSFSPRSVDSLDLVLEKRDKSSLEILDKIIVLPRNSVTLSTYAYEGDISISGDYIYMVFTDRPANTGTWYLQKRLKNDFAIVKEIIFTRRISSVSANEMSFKSTRKTFIEPLGTGGKYLQIKYSEGDILDNPMKLYNQAFKVLPEELR